MSREEAIAILKVDGCGDCTWQSLNPCVCENKECELKEALDMAISALEQKSCEDLEREYEKSKALFNKIVKDEDTISREAVIQTLNRMDRYTATELTLCDTDKKFPANEVFIVDDVYEQIAEHLPSVTQKSGWIPVSERLPKAGEYVGNVEKYYLVQNEYGDMLVARYTHSEYWEQIYQLKPVADEIVAWMPLPEPFEPQESEDKE